MITSKLPSVPLVHNFHHADKEHSAPILCLYFSDSSVSSSIPFDNPTMFDVV